MATSIEKRKKAAEKYVSKGKIEAAIKEYTKVLEETPKDINILNRLGDLHARLKRTDEAVRLFTGIAEQYTEEGFFVKAIAIYKKIIKLDPARLEVYEKLAALYHKQGLINEARTQYQVLADYYLKHNNAASAISIYQNMVELEPDNPSHHAKLAELYHQQKLPEKAIERYQKIADIMLRHGQGDQAGQVFERAFDVHAGIDFISSAVDKLKEGGHEGIAARVLAKAIEHNPEARQLLSGDLVPPAPEAVAEAVAEEEVSSQPDLEAEAVPEAAAAEVAEEDDDVSIDLVLDDSTGGPSAGDDLQAAMAAAAASVPEEDDDEDVSASEMDLDLEGFDDEPPSSQIQPPDDMDDDTTGLGFNRQFKAGMDTTGVDLNQLEAGSESDGGFELGSDDSQDDAQGFDLDDEIEIEIELEGTGFELETDPPEEAEEIEEVVETAALAEDDILSEAEVMTKYGLREKALERIHQVLSHNDQNLMAHRLLIQIHLDDDDADEVRAVAERMATIAVERGEHEQWSQVREMLERAGYSVAEMPRVPAPVEPESAVSQQEPDQEAEVDFDLVDLEPEDELVEIEVEPLPAPDPSFEGDATAEGVTAEGDTAEGVTAEAVDSGPEDSVESADAGLEAPPEATAFELGDLADETSPVVFADDTASDVSLAEDTVAEDTAAEATAAEATTLEESAIEIDLEGVPDDGAAGAGDLDAALADAAGARAQRPAASVEEAAASIEREVAAAELFSDSTASGVVVEPPSESATKPGGREDRINRLLGSLLEETGRKKKKSATEKALEDLLSETLGSRTRPKKARADATPAASAAEVSAPPSAEPTPEQAPASTDAPLDSAQADSTQPEAAQPEAAQPQAASPEAAPPQAAHPEAAQSEAAQSEATQPEPAPLEAGGSPVKMTPRPAIDADDVSDIEDALSFLGPSTPAAAPEAAPAADAAADSNDETAPATFEDTGMSWLDEVDSQPGQEAEDSIFEDEEGFFDLASELGDEAMAGVFDPSAQAEPPEEQSLDEIISGFKRGVAENLSTEDVDTHFNLGIAYREMGLLDEAIGEFQVAAKGESHLVQSCSMLGLCFQEKGLPELAIKWYTRGLAAPGLSEDDSLALLYDLGNAYLATGDQQKARQTFVEVYGINTNYRDIASKLASVQNAS